MSEQIILSTNLLITMMIENFNQGETVHILTVLNWLVLIIIVLKHIKNILELLLENGKLLVSIIRSIMDKFRK